MSYYFITLQRNFIAQAVVKFITKDLHILQIMQLAILYISYRLQSTALQFTMDRDCTVGLETTTEPNLVDSQFSHVHPARHLVACKLYYSPCNQSSAFTGKLQPRNKRRVSSESPKKKKSPPPPSPQHKKLKALTAAPSPKSLKSDKPPKSPKSDKPPKSEKLDKPHKLDKSDKLDKLPKEDKSDKPPKSEKSDKPPKSDKLDKPPKSDKSDNSPKSDKSDKPPKSTPPTPDPPSPPKPVSEDPPVPRATSPPTTKQSESEKLDKLLEKADGKSPSPQPIRLPTKSKSKPESDSDSDSRSTKSSASSTSKVARVFKKTFKGKAIAIVKPFSNPAPEKKSPDKEKKEPDSEPSLQAGDEYEFGEEEESGAVEGSSRRADSSGKPLKRLKGGKQLKSLRVRVEKLQGKKQVNMSQG